MALNKDNAALKMASPYGDSGGLTREQFLFHEMRTTAKLLMDGLDEKEITKCVIEENLFQYPTERMTNAMVKTILKRLKCLQDDSLVEAIATQPSNVAKQICLYAMMKQYRLVRDFMISLIGEKYRLLDMTFTKIDMNTFFMHLQEQDDWVATWSDSTVNRIKRVLRKILVDNEYLDNTRSEILRPVLISPILENSIRLSGDDQALAAFNCFA